LDSHPVTITLSWVMGPRLRGDDAEGRHGTDAKTQCYVKWYGTRWSEAVSAIIPRHALRRF